MALFDDLYGPNKIVGEGVLAALDAASRAAAGPRNNPDLFKRVWPGSPGTVAGNALGFLRYLTRDPGSALRVESAGGYSLTLDRAVTAPNAVIGVSFGKPAAYRSGWTFVHPGETIFVPGGFDKFYIFNADNLDQLQGGLPIAGRRPLGYCGFIAGTRPNGTPPDQTAPLPAVRLIHAVSTAEFVQFYFGPGAMRRVLVRAIAQDVNGAQIGGSFTADISFLQLFRAQQVAASFESETLDDPAQSSITTRRVLYIFGPNDGNGGIAQAIVTLPPAMVHAFQVANFSAWGGIAINRLLYEIEALD